MIVVPLEAASKANEFSLTPKAFTVSSESNGVGDVNRTATRRTLPGSSTPSRASVFGEPMVGGHRPQIRDAVQTEQHHRPPLFNDDRPLGVNLLELHHDLGACARRPHRRDP
jgi:hypothetical protein